ncbi:MAG: folylpolyglutamate synthase/dihydrofolate synthase family protein [Alphaproteobacteria bacterium]|nr:folylpolyglutamate synthase/dihydrofolate synthase family protein [Alphaproteobacteria bacterium]
MHLDPAIAAQLAALNHPLLAAIDLSLARVQALLAALGHPERRLPPVIHIAGTNGKGSTLAFLRAMYAAAGYRVHTYTSPHLVRFNERIVLSGSEISDAYLLELLQRVHAAAETIPVTFFEATTAAAFLAFSEHAADVLLLETGLGGRLDATNVVAHPLATILTPVEDDHREFLGDTLAEIAAEKAGILKRGAPCFVGAQRPEAREVIKRAARALDVRLVLHDRDWRYELRDGAFIDVLCDRRAWTLPLPALPGAHQHHNAALASVVAQSLPSLPVGAEAMARGVAGARWPARLQQLQHGPLVAAWGARGPVMLDGGHNRHAAQALSAWAATQRDPITLLWGMMQRKDARGFLEPIAAQLRQVITLPIAGNDSFSSEALAEIARTIGIDAVAAAGSPAEAPQYFLPGQGCLLIAGSLFLAGEVLKNHS